MPFLNRLNLNKIINEQVHCDKKKQIKTFCPLSEFLCLFQKNDIPLVTRMCSPITCAVGSKAETRTNSDDVYGGVPDNDLEMVYRAAKANKTVVDDMSLHNNRNTKNKKRERFADKIDKASRVMFPLAFIVYNVVYWVYYSN